MIGPERLSVQAVSRNFGEIVGVRHIDLSVSPGEIHALVGLNGAGKSTLLRLILGMLRPDAGKITISSQPIDTAPPAIWAQVGQLVEYPLAYQELTVRENLRLSARLHAVPRRAVETVVDDAVREFGLGSYAGTRSRNLSLGNRQRLGLASALQHEPQLIILDEPTNALDPRAVITLREALLNRAAAGAGVLVSSHHLDEVARIADRISVINEGRLIGSLDPSGIDIERAFFSLVYADSSQAA
ncbi:MAG TPA: ABC transporter ATP-binding protein [Propionibacteriaceae bacterium]|nr:ABC transporter ATP-binding protein [Propionibacteriaceae bacterium]